MNGVPPGTPVCAGCKFYESGFHSGVGSCARKSGPIVSDSIDPVTGHPELRRANNRSVSYAFEERRRGFFKCGPKGRHFQPKGDAR